MSTSQTATSVENGAPPRYRRKWRNLLIDVGLQIRYTAFILLVALFLTAFLGYKLYQAVKDTSEVIIMTGMVDTATMAELQAQFRANDRQVVYYILGLAFVLVVTVTATGIWVTHKVAGPLYSIEGICARVRDNKLAPSMRQQLRRGDELKEFYATFRDMYEALRVRADRDVQVLKNAVSELEQASPGSQALRGTIEDLRRLQAEKEGSLEP